MTEVQEAPAVGAGVCKRPGCGNPLPESSGRGRRRVFCGDECARRYHNDSRYGQPDDGVVAGAVHADPLGELESLLRESGRLVKAVRDQATGLDPARVRAELADAEAGRRRAEASVVTAEARQAEAESDAQALAEALEASRSDLAAAEETARVAREDAARLKARMEELERNCSLKISDAWAESEDRIAEVRGSVAHAEEERDDAVTALRDARTAADAEIGRARQAESDARAEVERVREDAVRERDALREACEAQVAAQQALTEAERARAERAEAELTAERDDRRQLTVRITDGADRKATAVRARSATAKKTGVASSATP